MKIVFLTLLSFFFLFPYSIMAQNIYFNAFPRTIELVKLNLETCETHLEFNFQEVLQSRETVIRGSSFHPDGYLYLTTGFRLIRYNILRKEVKDIIPIDDFAQQVNDGFFLAISEEGRFIISGGDHMSQIYDYDLRNRKVIQIIDDNGIPPQVIKGMTGFIGNHLLLYVGTEDLNNRGFRLWNPDSANLYDLWSDSSEEHSYFWPSMYTPACKSNSLLVQRVLEGTSQFVEIDLENKNVAQKCEDEIIGYTPLGSANPTDFRQSPLRIDLDADNSSYHATAGYYDTLTTCMPQAPITDDDIEISTCGAEVDYISFRLKYYDQPRLPEEYITAEGFEDQLQPTSDPSRWVWNNPYGNDTESIKDFLRSLRYHANWDPGNSEESRERVVAVTMHVGEDSTSSWSVFQLEPDDLYAGRDTTATYCADPDARDHIDLTSYLSEGVDAETGRFEPMLSGGRGMFVPGTDDDGEFQYILEENGCSDTAVITVETLETGLADLELDTVKICGGSQIRIGFPPGVYESIEWWDGSTGDSILISHSVIDPYALVSVGSCHVRIPIAVTNLADTPFAGPDTTFTYCPEGPAIDFNDHLPAPTGSTRWLEPGLQNGGSVFRPGIDDPGIYQYIVESEGCTDTAQITMEETGTQELPFAPVSTCEGQSTQIGLPAGAYSDIIWWNGESGDSTTINSDETGPFWVEAQQDGCYFRADFDVSVGEEILFPGSYPDTLRLCPGTTGQITVQGLDSILLDGAMYVSGDVINLTDPGEYSLTGYLGGCTATHSVSVTSYNDPSGQYSETFPRCNGTSLSITLPDDTEEYSFSWTDGHPDRELTVDDDGEYPFDISDGNCSFRAIYTVVPSDGPECEQEECAISIPNAVSPNGDGINDALTIFSTGCQSIESVALIDKWGNTIHTTDSQVIDTTVWLQLPPGVYMVKVNYRDQHGRLKTKAGSILVIR
ncbi:gliding motility-associated C-terminal domain-containing protein [Membranihabitans maritimus]|uniref:T9SS type B sorting domain-containing protein n=1 Tax=Membranihabitans maritimus TaxID=2904244 RepID=UPI001F334C68|nr:gliding motility-associated C-terminal domain-containing protein [Membranihabitans maritimus]